MASGACKEFVSGSTEHSQTVFAQHEADAGQQAEPLSVQRNVH